MKIKQPFENAYCGNGKLKACQNAIWAAIAAAGAELTAAQGPPTRRPWRSDAVARADRVRPRPAADDDALRQPPERDPAGDLVRRPPLSGAMADEPEHHHRLHHTPTHELPHAQKIARQQAHIRILTVVLRGGPGGARLRGGVRPRQLRRVDRVRDDHLHRGRGDDRRAQAELFRV